MWLQIGLWIFATILGEVLRPRTKRAGLDAGTLEIPDNRQDRKIPVVFGLAEIRGPLLGTYGLIKSEAITQEVSTGLFSSEDTTIGYRYYVGMQLICCHGRVDEFITVKFGRKTAITGSIQDGQVLIDKPTLFGPADQEGGVKGKMSFHSGSDTQGPDTFMQALLGEVPAHRGIAYCVWSNEYGDGGGYVGNSPSPPEVWITLRRYSKALGSGKHNINGHCNPAEVLYELHVNSNFGAGLSSAQIDQSSFLSAANALHAEGFAYSRLWSEPTDVETMVLDVLEHIDGLIYTDVATGKRTLKLARADYDPETLLELNDTNCVIESYGRPAWDDTTNEVHVNYTDETTGEGATALAQDLANLQIQGQTVATTINYPGIPTLAQAQRVAWRDLRALSYPQPQARIIANREAWTLRPGSVFKLSSSDLGFSGMIMRVQRIGYGTLGDGRIQIDAVQDIDGFGDTIYGQPSGSGWLDPIHAPVPAALQFLAEAPYFLAQAGGQILTWAAAPVYDAAEYQSQILQSGGVYTPTSVVPFGATGLLDAAISPTASVITLNTTQAMSMLASISEPEQRAGKNLAIVGDEWISFAGVAQIAAGIWQLTGVWRGVVDTVPSAHAAGARVYFLSGAAGTSPATYAAGQTVTAKYLPRTALGQLALGSATALSITMDNRAARPYPPARVQINGADYPATISGAYTISWRHRDRVAQTTIYNQDDPSIGPEAGTTYTLRLYGETDTLLRTETGLTGTSYTWSAEEADSGLTVPGSPGVTYNEDTFDTDSTASYTQYADTAASWAVSGGELVATGGLNSVFIRNGTSYTDVAIEADINYVHEGGMILRFIDNNNYYLLALSDDSGNNPPQNIRFFKRAGGTFTSLGTAGITWARGTSKTIRFQASGTTLTAYVDGASVLSVTDTAITGPGGVGMRNYGPGGQQSKYQAFRWDIQGSPAQRLNGTVRAEIESVRAGLISHQKHNITVDRAGYGYQYGKYYGGT